ncbi:MAG: hypothetical protein KGH64_03200 [Candidatus Micrarchaeota archaeon]|nr:hypothetical protein [Candidatus Micrarchaeota archaeon]MDE1834319.1 hypothetical protein [Candidatus Micrarchaeota archaeon]MDE1859096.1 hypothetical protein [Candidatus Micrarchaeota archaeon]
MAGTITTVRFRTMFAGVRSTKRHSKAGPYLRKYIAKYNKVDPQMVKIDKKVNEYMMANVVSTGGVLKLLVNKNAGILEVKLANDKSAVKADSAPAKAAATPGNAASGVIQEKPKATAPQAQKQPAAAAQKTEKKREEKPQPKPVVKDKVDQAQSAKDTIKSAENEAEREKR